MGRKPTHEKPMTATERKRVQRLRDRRNLNEGVIHPGEVPLRTLLQLVSEGHEIAWREIGRRKGWLGGGKEGI